jgi:hypothetical protein
MKVEWLVLIDKASSKCTKPITMAILVSCKGLIAIHTFSSINDPPCQ